MDKPIRSFRDVTTWQVARDLCLAAYKGTDSFPAIERCGLTSQIRRSAISIPSNIAEGFGRQGAKEKQHFYHHSLGSLFELETQIEISKSLNYLSDEAHEVIDFKLNQCRRLLLALLNANRVKIANPQSLIPNQ